MANKSDVLWLASKGVHPSDIAAFLDCDTSYVRKTFYRNGLKFERRVRRQLTKTASSRAWEKRDPILRDLWGKRSCVEIAAKLGVTKNAVIGRAHRLGLKKLQGGRR